MITPVPLRHDDRSASDSGAAEAGAATHRPAVLPLRLAVGLCQGIGAWQLARDAAWHADRPALFSALLVQTAFVPLILLAGLGRMRAAALAGWVGVAAQLMTGWALYAVWRDPAAGPGAPAFDIAIKAALALYVAHHLIEPADAARRWPPPYPDLVDGAWRHVVQLVLSSAFAAVLWGVIELGAALFDVIGIHAVGHLVRDGAFAWPVLGLAFAGAVHLTDVRPALIEGVRSLALTLLAWMLPVATGLLAAFLLALAATGLAPLWATGRSATLLLAAAALLVVLINAAYQDGRRTDGLPAAIRWAGRLAGVLLVPLAVLAGSGVAVRVEEHGLTPERVYGLAAVTVTAVYALGYLWAAASRGPWMRRLESVNVAAALAGFATILLLLSPVLDPGRLTADDQFRRLESGTATASDLPVLRWNAGRFGREALVRLAASSNLDLARAARQQLADTPEAQPVPRPGPAFSRARILPPGQALPQDFRDQPWTPEEAGYSVGACLVDDTPCDITVGDTLGDGRTQVIVRTGHLGPQLFARDANGRWVHRGYWDDAGCPGAADALSADRVRTIRPETPDLAAGGIRLRFHAIGGCAAAPPP